MTFRFFLVLFASLALPSAPVLAEATLALWSADAMERIGRFAPPQPADERQIFAAGNDWEAFQVVIRADAAAMAKATLSVSPFVGKNHAALPKPRVYREAFVTVKKASQDSPLGTGEYADALIPASSPPLSQEKRVEVDGPYNQPYWIDQFVPADAAPGEYTSTITLQAVGETRVIRVKLTVWPFSLPPRPLLRSAIGCSWRRIAEIHEVPDDAGDASLRATVDAYHELLAQHHLCVADAMPSDLVPTEDGFVKTFPESYFRKYFERWNYNSFALPIWEDWPFKAPFGEHRELTRRYLSSLMKALKQRGWAKYCYVLCPVDEPNSAEAYAKVREWGRLCREAETLCGIKIPLLCTEPPTPQVAEWGSLQGAVDLWVVHFGDLWSDLRAHSPATLQRQRAGDEVWAYGAMVQFPDSFKKSLSHKIKADQHPPVWLIDFAPMNFRIPGFLSAAKGWSGLLYWETLNWPASSSPWDDTATFREGELVFNGDGQWIYPSKHGPIASLRLKWLREAFEDHALFAMVAQAGLLEEALATVRPFTITPASWTADPSVLQSARLRLAKILSNRPPRAARRN